MAKAKPEYPKQFYSETSDGLLSIIAQDLARIQEKMDALMNPEHADISHEMECLATDLRALAIRIEHGQIPHHKLTLDKR